MSNQLTEREQVLNLALMELKEEIGTKVLDLALARAQITLLQKQVRQLEEQLQPTETVDAEIVG